jgi:beta-N-acetylglucosaminidase
VGWQDWVQDGAFAGTEGKALRLEAIRVRIVRDNSTVYGGLGIQYRTHVQNVGWQEYVLDGGMSGTSGMAYRLEGINISLTNAPAGMKIKYQTHVQDIGWQNWVYDGQLSGTSGQAKRLEGIKIALEGAPVGYHVMYQVHIQNVGWQNWVYDGGFAGTEGKGLRLEAIRIKIVDTKTFNYVGYNVTFDQVLNDQLNNTPALQMKNTSGQWEWRYAQKQNGVEGYYIFVPKLDDSGNVVKDGNGNTVTVKQWTAASDVYQAIKQELYNNLDVATIMKDGNSIYEFLKLSYVEGTTADQLNAIFNPNGVLAGKGQAFIDAGKKYNVNPIYLAAHSIWETNNGTSNLAKGIVVNNVTVYNLFGIGAVDSNADASGSNYAYNQDPRWDSIDKAIDGGAAWIAKGYINNSDYHQDTLYKMKWNPGLTPYHEYATDVKWAKGQTAYIKKCFDLISDAKLYFEIPCYK